MVCLTRGDVQLFGWVEHPLSITKIFQVQRQWQLIVELPCGFGVVQLERRRAPLGSNLHLHFGQRKVMLRRFSVSRAESVERDNCDDKQKYRDKTAHINSHDILLTWNSRVSCTSIRLSPEFPDRRPFPSSLPKERLQWRRKPTIHLIR